MGFILARMRIEETSGQKPQQPSVTSAKSEKSDAKTAKETSKANASNKSATGERSKEKERKSRRDLENFVRPSRVIIDSVEPQIEGGRFAAKRFIDQPVEICVILLVDGHDHVKGRVLYRHETETQFQSIPLTAKVNDEWVATFQPKRLGRYLVTVEAGMDRFDTWRSDILKKLKADQAVDVDLRSGIQLLESWLLQVKPEDKHFLMTQIADLNALLKTASKKIELSTLTTLLGRPVLEKLASEVYDKESFTKFGREIPIQVEPKIARFSSWYEFFPRSVVGSSDEDVETPGTLLSAIDRLDYVKQMGFNVLYFPPIHPIGLAFRKGKNNTLTPTKDDVGSPWAIGAAEGGHKDILPELGTFADFERLMSEAHTRDIKIALDIAFQCSPDHPYVKEHPEWFKKRPDGTIQYAENPPKKYQDIYPFDFESPAWHSLWNELLSVVQFWVDKGVRVFRVDNPHTKSLHFWEWLISEVRQECPEVIFLAEAFTRPHLMDYLAKAGFSQSYTYFTWRTTKAELTQYLTELTKTKRADVMMPNFWPNTPDILPAQLQAPNRAMYMQRFVLASTLSSSYGIYGPAFELMDFSPRVEGAEEYLDSEKYEVKKWDIENPQSLSKFIERVNEIRNLNPPLQNNDTIRFHEVPNDQLIAFSKTSGDEIILVVVNLDPHHVQSGMVELPLIDWKIDPSETFQVHDLLTDARYFWTGWRNYVELDPQSLPAHIFSVKRRTLQSQDFDYFT